MYCEALNCKMTRNGCAARKKAVEEQQAAEDLPKRLGRPAKKSPLLISAEKCLECNGELKELDKGGDIVENESEIKMKICKECGKKKGLYCFDGRSDIWYCPNLNFSNL